MDLAGFAVGVVEKDRLLGPAGPHPPEEGDVLVGLHSGGMRSNGYSLARAALLDRAGRRLDDEAWPGAGHSLADELLRPSPIYSPAVRSMLPLFDVHAVAHITGGGLPGNVPRALPPHLDALIHLGNWPVPRIFAEVKRVAGVDDAEMSRTFNMGVGMVVVIPADQGAAAAAKLQDLGFPASVIGEVVAGQGRCLLE
jgi:phosphoribosylformylglycinamidine cyclo-ligase